MQLITIRVYGILKDSKNNVLVSDECIKGNLFTKFPGGGLEVGEGTRDCLQREFMEELGLAVSVEDHIYTTDYFQASAFNTAQQILSIYYFVKAVEPLQIKTSNKKFDFTPEQINNKQAQFESCRWIHWNDFSENDVDLPIDKLVVSILKNKV